MNPQPLAILIPLILSTLTVVETEDTSRPGVSSADYDEHAPIFIDSDDDFETGDLPILRRPNVENGVRGGSGTAEDPYRIENWRIKEEGGGREAIRILGTTKHVLIRNVILEAHTLDEGRTGPAAFLQGARNVRFENVDVGGMHTAFLLANVEDVAIDSTRVWGNAQIQIQGSSGVAFRGLHIEGTGTQVSWLSSNGKISDTVLENTSPTGQIPGGGKVRVGLSIGAALPSDDEASGPSNVRIDRLRVINFTAWDPKQLPASGNWGVRVSGSSTVTISESHFLGNLDGLVLYDSRVEVHDSVFVGNDVGINVLGACGPCTIRGTEFVGNREYDIRNEGSGTVDAAENWWGSVDGPGPDRIGGKVTVRPWLRQGEHHDEDRSASGLPWLLVSAVALLAGVLRRRPPLPRVGGPLSPTSQTL